MLETVKTAISLKKPLFEKANKTAQEMKLSRSGLISVALEDYIYRKECKDIQDSWNGAYSGGLTKDDKELLDDMSHLFGETLEPDEW